MFLLMMYVFKSTQYIFPVHFAGWSNHPGTINSLPGEKFTPRSHPGVK